MELQKKGQLLIISERVLLFWGEGEGRGGGESFIRGSGPQDTRAGYYRILEQDTTGYYRILQDTRAGYYRIL